MYIFHIRKYIKTSVNTSLSLYLKMVSVLYPKITQKVFSSL